MTIVVVELGLSEATSLEQADHATLMVDGVEGASVAYLLVTVGVDETGGLHEADDGIRAFRNPNLETLIEKRETFVNDRDTMFVRKFGESFEDQGDSHFTTDRAKTDDTKEGVRGRGCFERTEGHVE